MESHGPIHGTVPQSGMPSQPGDPQHGDTPLDRGPAGPDAAYSHSELTSGNQKRKFQYTPRHPSASYNSIGTNQTPGNALFQNVIGNQSAQSKPLPMGFRRPTPSSSDSFKISKQNAWSWSGNRSHQNSVSSHVQDLQGHLQRSSESDNRESSRSSSTEDPFGGRKHSMNIQPNIQQGAQNTLEKQGDRNSAFGRRQSTPYIQHGSTSNTSDPGGSDGSAISGVQPFSTTPGNSSSTQRNNAQAGGAIFRTPLNENFMRAGGSVTPMSITPQDVSALNLNGPGRKLMSKQNISSSTEPGSTPREPPLDNSSSSSPPSKRFFTGGRHYDPPRLTPQSRLNGSTSSSSEPTGPSSISRIGPSPASRIFNTGTSVPARPSPAARLNSTTSSGPPRPSPLSRHMNLGPPPAHPGTSDQTSVTTPSSEDMNDSDVTRTRARGQRNEALSADEDDEGQV